MQTPGWENISFLYRLPSSRTNKDGSYHYPIPKTDRVYVEHLHTSLKACGIDYVRKYAPTEPNAISCYKAKIRYSRDPYPLSTFYLHSDDDERNLVEVSWALAAEMMEKHYGYLTSDVDILSWDDVAKEVAKNKATGACWRDIFRTKRDFLAWPKCKEFLEDYWDALSYDDYPSSFWLDKQKLEVRLLEKCADNNLRGFNCSSVEFVLASNRFCLHWNQKFYEAGAAFQCFSSVGFSRYFRGWHNLVQAHLDYNPCGTFSIDLKKCDASLFNALLWQNFQLRLRAFRKPLSREDYLRLYHLFLDRTNRMTVAELGDIILTYLGVGSGDPNTIIEDTLGFSYMWFYAYIILSFRRGDTPSYAHFKRNIHLSLNGDDCLFTTRPGLEWFNPLSIQSVLTPAGIVLEFETFEPRPANECTYLGCISHMVGGFYLPCPKMERVLGCLIEGSKSDNVLWTMLRLYAVRIDTWGNPEIRKLIMEMIKWYWSNYRSLLVGQVKVPNRAMFITWDQIHSVYKTDDQLLRLYTGMEGELLLTERLPDGGYARNSTTHYIFEGKMNTLVKHLPLEPLQSATPIATWVDSDSFMEQAGTEFVNMSTAATRLVDGLKPDSGLQSSIDHDFQHGSRIGEASNPGPPKTVRESFHDRKWYDPVHIAGHLMGATEDTGDSAFKKYIADPAVGILEKATRPVLKHLRGSGVPMSDRQRFLRDSGLKETWDQAESDLDRVDPIRVEEAENTLQRIQQEFDATKGYPGEGPPKSKKGQSRKGKKSKKKSKKQSIKFAKAVSSIKKTAKKQAKAVVNKLIPNYGVKPRSMKLGAKSNGSKSTEKAFLTEIKLTKSGSTYSLTQYSSLMPQYPVIPISPYIVGSAPFTSGFKTDTQQEADWHEQYRVDRWTLDFETPLGTFMTGQFACWFDPDPSDDNTYDNGDESIMQLIDRHKGRLFFFNQQRSTYHVNASKKWFWCRRSTGSDERLVSPGNIYVTLIDDPAAVYSAAYRALNGTTVSDGTVSLGKLFLSTTFSFKTKILSETQLTGAWYQATQVTGATIDMFQFSVMAPDVGVKPNQIKMSSSNAVFPSTRWWRTTGYTVSDNVSTANSPVVSTAGNGYIMLNYSNQTASSQVVRLSFTSDLSNTDSGENTWYYYFCLTFDGEPQDWSTNGDPGYITGTQTINGCCSSAMSTTIAHLSVDLNIMIPPGLKPAADGTLNGACLAYFMVSPTTQTATPAINYGFMVSSPIVMSRSIFELVQQGPSTELNYKVQAAAHRRLKALRDIEDSKGPVLPLPPKTPVKPPFPIQYEPEELKKQAAFEKEILDRTDTLLDSPVITGIPGDFKLVDKFGDKGYPGQGPILVSSQRFLIWATAARKLDVSVRSVRAQLAEKFNKVEQKDGDMEIASSDYQKTIMWLNSTRNNPDDPGKLGFQKTLLELIEQAEALQPQAPQAF